MDSPAVDISWPSFIIGSFDQSFNIQIEQGNSLDALDFVDNTKSPACDNQNIPKPPTLHRKKLNGGLAKYCGIPKETKNLWERLFKEGYGADVHVMTDDESIIAAHQSVLRVASPVLRNFLQQSKVKNGFRSIRIPGVPCGAVYAFIRFLYSSCYEEEEMRKFVIPLLVLSHSYVVPSLKRVCGYILEQGWLTKENVIDVLQLAKSCDIPRLALVCQRIIVRDFRSISSTEAWKVMKRANPSLEQELLESVVEEDSRKQERLKKS